MRTFPFFLVVMFLGLAALNIVSTLSELETLKHCRALSVDLEGLPVGYHTQAVRGSDDY